MADWVTIQPHGRGVIELIGRLLGINLQDLDLTRHYLCLGHRIRNEEFSICPYGPNNPAFQHICNNAIKRNTPGAIWITTVFISGGPKTK